MIGYKLFRQKKNGISSLFINSSILLPTKKWIKAEKNHLKKGFKYRPFWHVMEKPVAPHLSEKNRTWYKVSFGDYKEFNRPIAQGGKWFLANKIKILEKL